MIDRPADGFDTREFLARYWQRRPCLMRGAFPRFEPGLDGDDLAGLACEAPVEARIVTGSFEKADWTLEYGPFEERRFGQLGDADWTLLVQDVEKHYPPLQALLAQFAFLPAWRLDDLMVSFAAPGGSVGPHVDQYDVFLLQAEGRRHWRIARRYDPALLPDCPLNVLQRFEPEQAWTLEPGDMLYLPPGVAHHGVAVDPCLTFSIGLRAPSAADLFLALGEALAEDESQGGRYADPGIAGRPRAGEIDREALRGLRRLLNGHLDNIPTLESFLAAFLSRYRLANDPAPPPEPVSVDAVVACLRQGGSLARNPWTRLTWIERDGRALLFAAGQACSCSIELAELLCGPLPAPPSPESLDPASLAALQQLLENGHVHLIPA